MKDCFGITVDEAELVRWDQATWNLAKDYWMKNITPSSFRVGPTSEKERVEWCKQTLGDAADAVRGKVVEVGCGVGNALLYHLRSAPELYIGLDVSKFCIGIAKERFREWKNALFFHTVFDAEEANKHSEGADLIFMWNTAIHLPLDRIKSIVKWSWDKLKDGGYCVIDIRIGGNSIDPSKWVPGANWSTFPHKPREIKGIMKKAGFKEMTSWEVGDNAVRGYVLGRK